jgi:hypothetical protein
MPLVGHHGHQSVMFQKGIFAGRPLASVCRWYQSSTLRTPGTRSAAVARSPVQAR